jgi:hypothetical protein
MDIDHTFTFCSIRFDEFKQLSLWLRRMPSNFGKRHEFAPTREGCQVAFGLIDLVSIIGLIGSINVLFDTVSRLYKFKIARRSNTERMHTRFLD